MRPSDEILALTFGRLNSKLIVVLQAISLAVSSSYGYSCSFAQSAASSSPQHTVRRRNTTASGMNEPVYESAHAV